MRWYTLVSMDLSDNTTIVEERRGTNAEELTEQYGRAYADTSYVLVALFSGRLVDRYVGE